MKFIDGATGYSNSITLLEVVNISLGMPTKVRGKVILGWHSELLIIYETLILLLNNILERYISYL